MARKIELSIKEFLDLIPTLIITDEDIEYIFSDEEMIKQFKKVYYLHTKGDYDIGLLQKFLTDNKEHINKENLVLTLAKNCKTQFEIFEEELKEAEQIENIEKKVFAIAEINKRKKICENTIKQIRRIGKGLDIILTFYRQNDDKKCFELEIVDSRELIDKKHISKSKTIRRLEKIENAFTDDEEKFGIGYILQVLNIADLKEVFPINIEDGMQQDEENQEISYIQSRKFGGSVVDLIVDRKILNESYLDYKELKNIDFNRYISIRDEMKYDDFIPYIKDALKEYSAYVDLDKLLLIAAYKYNMVLENTKDKKETVGYEEIIKVILDNIENKNAKYSFVLEYELDGEIVIKPDTYSVKELEKFSRRFVNDEYISEKEIQEYRDKIENGEQALSNIDESYIDIIFTKEDLENYASLSLENFEYVAKKLGWEGQEKVDKIISLYEQGSFSIEQIKVLKQTIDLSEKVNPHELNQYYKNATKEDSTQEDKNKFSKYIDLYKELVLSDKSEEEIEENHNILVDFLMDNYKGEDYIKVVGEYYQKGLIPIEVLIEWNGEEIIQKMFDLSIIDIEKLKKLSIVGVISPEYINKIYDEEVLKKGLTQQERVDILKSGYCSKDAIRNLYLNYLIDQGDLTKLCESCLISEEEKEKLKSELTLENSKFILRISKDPRKITNENYSGNTERIDYDEDKKRIIIDPEKREEFFKLLGAVKCEAEENESFTEENPFYNYEFYVIPDENGEITPSSVVIAERYYEDKISEKRFATGNATYFFKRSDLEVVNEYGKKDEVVKEKENVIFRSIHTNANEKSDGHWATSVIENLIKATLSSDLKEYNKEEKAMLILNEMIKRYDQETLRKIYTLEKQIDSGEHLYEIIREKNKKVVDLSDVGEGR